LIEARDNYDAEKVHNAIAGLGTNDEELIETICTRTNTEILAMKAAYQRLYHKEIEKDVAGDTSGDYKRLLITILRGDRPEQMPPNTEQAKMDAQRLYSAGEGRMGTDEGVFIEILTQRSFPQLHLIAQIYGQIAGHSLESGIAKETSFNFKHALIVLITPREEFFAHQFRKSIEGMGTKDHILIRILSYMSNYPALCKATNNYYMHCYKHNLVNDIGGDTSGWYKKTAQALMANRINL